MPVEAGTREWIEEVMEQHAHLRAAVAEMKQFACEARPDMGKTGYHTWAAELSKRLVNLHDELFRHFRYEEVAGVMEELTLSHPEAATKLEDILSEHPKLLRKNRRLIADVLSYSEGRDVEDPRLRRRICSLLDALQRHEQDETALIQKLEYRDVGAAD